MIDEEMGAVFRIDLFGDAHRTVELCKELGTPAEKEGLLLLLRAIETRYILKNGGGEHHKCAFDRAVDYWHDKVVNVVEVEIEE